MPVIVSSVRFASTYLLLALLLPLQVLAADTDSGFKLSGYVHYYARDYRELVGSSANRSEFRRLRPVFEYQSGRWYAQFMPDLARDSNITLYAYLDYHADAGWDVRVGRFKSPISMDRLRSVNSLAIAENSAAALMTPARDNGVLWGYGGQGEDSWRFELGLFDGAVDGQVKGSLDGGYESVARILRIQPAAGGALRYGVSIGVGERKGTIDKRQLARYRTPGRATWFGYRSDAIADGRVGHLSIFTDYYRGPGFLQAEWIQSSETAANASNRQRLEHRGWELQGGYVLTGEARKYAGVTPSNWRLPLFNIPMAMEIAGRIAGQNADEDAFTSGLANPLTSGRAINAYGATLSFWFPKKWRLALDYEQSRIDFTGASPDLREKLFMAVMVMTF